MLQGTKLASPAGYDKWAYVCTRTHRMTGKSIIGCGFRTSADIGTVRRLIGVTSTIFLKLLTKHIRPENYLT